MKKYNSITIALIVLGVLVNICATALAGSSEQFLDEEWNRTYKVGDIYNVQSLQKTSDGGYIIIGTLSKNSNDGRYPEDYFLVKTDSMGNEQWNRIFREQNKDGGVYISYIMQTSDLGYLIAGDTNKYDTGSSKLWLTKTDTQGNEQWKKDFRGDRPIMQSFGGNNITGRINEAHRSVMETQDGGFLVMGNTGPCQDCSKGSEQPMDIWLMKIDSGGSEEWNRTLGKTNGSAFSFQVTSDSGFVLAGTSNSNITWLMKSDQSGNELWNRTFQETGGRAVVVQQASDGGYAIAVTDTSGSQTWLIKTDPDGQERWNKTYNSFDIFLQTRDGGFLIHSVSPDESLLKVDSNGTEQWKKIMTEMSIMSISYFEQTNEGGYIFAGTKYYYDSILGSCIVKLDPRGKKLWEKVLRDELSWSIDTQVRKTEDGYVVVGISSDRWNLKLMKFKSRDNPFAMFTYEPEYPGVNQTVTFDASLSSDLKGNITNYRWDFGDGNTSDTTGKKVTHSYAKTGEVSVKLTLMNNSAGVNSTWKKVFVQELMAPEETMNVTFGNFSGAKYAQETADGGFIIAGRNDSIYDGWLVKTDPDGKEKWNLTFKGVELKSVIETSDGGFMAAGEYNMSDIRLIKIDKTGTEEWNRLFNSKGLGSIMGFGIISGENGTVAQTHDGGYVIAGINKWAAGDNLDAWLLKTDPDGNYSWSMILRGNKTGQNILSSVQETPDGYYVTGTWWNPYGGPDPGAVLLKTDQKGNEKWAWTRIISINDHAGPGLQTSDGGFVMMGTSSYFNQSNWTSYWTNYTGPEWNTEIWLMKTDSQGNEQWRTGNRVKKLAFEASFSATEDSGYIYSVIVQERLENDYENDIYGEIYSVKFVKLDSDGNIEWQKRDEGYSIKPTSDGGYVTARGSQLVKFGGVRHEPLKSVILQETPITTPTQILMAGSNETQTVTPPEKAAGFEASLVILMFLAVFISRRKIW